MIIISHETYYAALYIYEEHVVQYFLFSLFFISPSFFQGLATLTYCIALDFRFNITCVISFYISIISI